jgi:hypothetical protein
MKPTESLFELIKSLNKTEKGYFKKFSQINESNAKSNYMLLFDAIDNQEKYDEEALLKKFKKQSFVKQFPVAKNYLHEKILAALNSYDNSDCSDVQSLLHSAEFLIKKALYDQAYKTLQKAKKLVKQQELVSYLLEIHHWEYNIAIEKHDMVLADKINEEWQQSIFLSQNVQTYRSLYTKMATLFHNYGRTKDKKIMDSINALIKNPALENESSAITFYSKIRFYDTHLYYWSIIGDRDQVYAYANKIVRLFHDNPEKIKAYIEIYMDCLKNILSSSLKDKKFNEANYYLETLKEISKSETSKNISAKFFYTYTRQLLYYNNTIGYFDKSIQEIPGILNSLKLYEDALNPQEKSVLYFNISISFFGMMDYKSCLFWLNKIRNEISMVFSPDIHRFIYLFYIITHYELGNIDLLGNLSDTAIRFLSKNNSLREFDRIIFGFTKNKFPLIVSRKDTVEYFTELLEKLKANTAETPRESDLYFFVFVQSKLENQTFAEIIKKNTNYLDSAFPIICV